VIRLDKTKDCVRNNDWPQKVAIDSIDYKKNAAHKVYNPYLLDIFQDKTKNYEERGGITDKVCNFWTHKDILKGAQT
jgi:hypothetical protein